VRKKKKNKIFFQSRGKKKDDDTIDKRKKKKRGCGGKEKKGNPALDQQRTSTVLASLEKGEKGNAGFGWGRRRLPCLLARKKKGKVPGTFSGVKGGGLVSRVLGGGKKRSPAKILGRKKRVDSIP